MIPHEIRDNVSFYILVGGFIGGILLWLLNRLLEMQKQFLAFEAGLKVLTDNEAARKQDMDEMWAMTNQALAAASQSQVQVKELIESNRHLTNRLDSVFMDRRKS